MGKGTIRENVEALLKLYPATRDNDKLLMLTYWEEVDGIEMSSRFDFVFKSTSPESIRRARQLIQEEGMYLPSSETVAKRRGRQKEMKKAIKLRRVI